MQELSLLCKDEGDKLTEQYHLYFAELLSKIGLSEFDNDGPVPPEIWIGLMQAFSGASGYKATLQAAVLEPVPGDPNTERIIGYREIASAEPTLFVKAAISGAECSNSLECGTQFRSYYDRRLTMQQLSLLFREEASKLTELHRLYFAELFARLGLSGFDGPVPPEIWAGVIQAISDASGYKLTLQAAIVKPTRDDPNTERIIGYRKVASADPSLFVKPVE